MSNTNLFAPEDIAEIAEHLTLDDAKDILAMNYGICDSDLHAVSSTVPVAVGPAFVSEELTNTTTSESLKARIEYLEKAVYLLIRNNIDSTKLNCNRDARFESILEELRDIKNDFVKGK